MAIGAISIATEHRNEAAALRFLGQAMSANSLPRACAIDTSEANAAGLKVVNVALREAGSRYQIWVHRSKYLENLVEQVHRGVKRRIRTTMGFKSIRSAWATLDGIDTAHLIREGQLGKGCPFVIYASLAA